MVSKIEIVSFQISRLPRRQLFLVRNIRKFKLRNALNKLPSTESPSSPTDNSKSDLAGGDVPRLATSSSQVSTTTVETASMNIDSAVRGTDDSDVTIKSTVEAAVTNETVSSTTINR